MLKESFWGVLLLDVAVGSHPVVGLSRPIEWPDLGLV